MVVAIPAAAMSPEDAKGLCAALIELEIVDPEGEQECVDMRQRESVPAAHGPLRAVIPPSLIVADPGRNDGDRYLVTQTLRSGAVAEVVIEFESREVRVEANARAIDRGLRSLSVDELAYKRSRYSDLKEEAISGIQGITVLRDFENLASSLVRVSSEAALEELLTRPEVVAVYENRIDQLFLAQSLALIEQPPASTLGFRGAGTTVAVLDTGVDYTISAFNNCTSPGQPAGCRVVATYEAADEDSSLDNNGHGTNVSAIVAAAAEDADLFVVDVLSPSGILFADVLEGLSEVIASQQALNIVAVNLSFGTVNTRWQAPCGLDQYAAPLADVLAAGVQPVAASGNFGFYNGSYLDGIASPACAPSAVSVGSVYDANVGLRSYVPSGIPQFACTDTSTGADEMSCFSQSATALSLLAPGSEIIAGGFVASGTSQATPHVAGAWAVVSGGFPSLNEAQILGLLQAGGEPILDSRPSGGRTTSRINLVPEPGQLQALGIGILALLGMSFWRRQLS